ncbi:head decoration protein [uncultured Sphingobium sp.]|uniref:head decoration protein n=1 Tax=uncultured Sphingobium sp. TaxID=316087 RepID=UPI0032B190F9|tara:strand:+ start:26303 stop:26698 length:396 start_codon:yes stop_codon:yes gene_type:complete
MAVLNYENRRDGCYLGESAALNIINEEIIVASGAGVLSPGTVLGKITASSKYVVHDTALTNGAELPDDVIILFNRVDATSADKKAVGTTNGPATINGNDLTFKAGMTDAAKKAAMGGLRKKGMKVLPQHAG